MRQQLDDPAFDTALVTAAFELAEEVGWMRVSAAGAARRAGLPLDLARARFSSSYAILACFGRLADQAALADIGPLEAAAPDGAVRDRLFDMLMRRMDVLQSHRGGMLALLRGLPFDPLLAATLAGATLRSMAWMLEAAGLEATGPRGALRADGLLAVWLWTMRAWKDDDTADLSATMSALDRALDRAEQAEAWLAPRATAKAADPDYEQAAPQAPMPALLPDAAGPGFPSTSPPPPD